MENTKLVPRMADRRVVAYTKRLNEEHAATGDVEGARRLIEQMLADGVEPSIVTANTLIKAYRQARMPKGAEAVLREMALDWGLTADGASYCTVIDAWGLSGSPDEAARVLQEAEAAGVADSRCYAARLRHLAGPDDGRMYGMSESLNGFVQSCTSYIIL